MTFVLSAPETAFLLRLKLGPIRAWTDTLHDMRRGRASVCGFVLKPVVRVHDGISWRPEYAVEDIHKFIENVTATHPDAKSGVPPRVMEVELDPIGRLYGVVSSVRR